MSNIFDTYWIRTNRIYGKKETDNSIMPAKGVFRWEQNKFVPVEKMCVGNADKEFVEVWHATPSEYEFEIKPQYNFQTIPYSGGLFECFVINSKNAGFLTFGRDNIQILGYNETGVPPVGLSVADVIFDDVLYEQHKHVVTFRFTKNTTSSAKYWTVKFTQPESGNELTLNCIQAAKPSGGGGGGGDASSVTANIQQAYRSDSEIHYFITFEGIESYLDYITVEVNDNYEGDGNIYGEPVTHETIIPNDSATGHIIVYDQIAPLYIIVRDSSNKVIGSQIIE